MKVKIIWLSIFMIIAGGAAVLLKPEKSVAPVDTQEAVFCTMDAMQCPDGSWIGRTGPKCEFVCSN